MKVHTEFKIGLRALVGEIFADEYICRGGDFEPGEKLTDLDKKNLTRLAGCVGTIISVDYHSGFESHWYVTLEFSNKEEWGFSTTELELTELPVTAVPPFFKEVSAYEALTIDEKRLAEKLFVVFAQQHPDIDEFIKENDHYTYHAVMKSRDFLKKLNRRWLCGTEIVQGEK